MFLPFVFLSALVTESFAGTTCPGNYEAVSGSCFYFHAGNSSFRMNWEASRKLCKETGGDLAILNDCFLFKDVVRFIQFNPSYDIPKGTSYWIGGSDEGEEGRWFWIDATAVALGLPFWGSVQGVPEPSGGDKQNCAILYRDDRYYFHDGECEKIAYPLCQTQPLES